MCLLMACSVDFKALVTEHMRRLPHEQSAASQAPEPWLSLLLPPTVDFSGAFRQRFRTNEKLGENCPPFLQRLPNRPLLLCTHAVTGTPVVMGTPVGRLVTGRGMRCPGVRSGHRLSPWFCY